jgi:hypothetical protein
LIKAEGDFEDGGRGHFESPGLESRRISSRRARLSVDTTFTTVPGRNTAIVFWRGRAARRPWRREKCPSVLSH